MRKLLNIKMKNEKGLAMIIVLITIGVGGLLASVTVGFAGTVLKERIVTSKYVDRVYAADAGIEDALWCIQNNVTPRTALPLSPNGASVAIQVDQTEGTYTLYAGQWVATSVHSDWLNIDSTISLISCDDYRYTITISRTVASSSKTIWLEECGAQLPPGYTYVTDTSSGLSGFNPVDTIGSYGAHILTWDFSAIKWDDDNPRTQVFNIQGTGTLSDYSGWVIGRSNDIDVVGELTGGFYKITATATTPSDNKSTTVTVNAMTTGVDVLVLSWRVNP